MLRFSIALVAGGLMVGAAHAQTADAPGLREIAKPTRQGLREVRVLAALPEVARADEARPAAAEPRAAGLPSTVPEIIRRPVDPNIQALEDPKPRDAKAPPEGTDPAMQPAPGAEAAKPAAAAENAKPPATADASARRPAPGAPPPPGSPELKPPPR